MFQHDRFLALVTTFLACRQIFFGCQFEVRHPNFVLTSNQINRTKLDIFQLIMYVISENLHLT